MSEMIERVAAVIAAEIMELTADQRASFHFPDDANGDTCDRARSAARAAIEAMRAHFLVLSGPDFCSSEFDGAIEVIDEALK